MQGERISRNRSGSPVWGRRSRLAGAGGCSGLEAGAQPQWLPPLHLLQLCAQFASSSLVFISDLESLPASSWVSTLMGAGEGRGLLASRKPVKQVGQEQGREVIQSTSLAASLGWEDVAPAHPLVALEGVPQLAKDGLISLTGPRLRKEKKWARVRGCPRSSRNAGFNPLTPHHPHTAPRLEKLQQAKRHSPGLGGPCPRRAAKGSHIRGCKCERSPGALRTATGRAALPE